MGRLQRKKHLVKARDKRKKREKKNLKSGIKGGLVSKAFNSNNNVLLVKKRKKIISKPFFSKVTSILMFFKESKIELQKVVWPSRKQAMGSTFVVIFIVSLVSVFLGVIDAGLSAVIRLILG